MRYLALLVFLIGCSNSEVQKDHNLKVGKSFCSCHKGLWYIEDYPNLELIGIKCNDGTQANLTYTATVLTWCNQE